MNPPAWKEPVAIFEDLDKDENIRAIIITGKGSCFTAGIDLMGMMPALPELLESSQKDGTKWKLLPKIHELQDAMTCIEKCKKPGGGLL